MIRKLLTLVLAVAVIVSMVIVGCAKPAPAPTPTPAPAPAPAPAPPAPALSEEKLPEYILYASRGKEYAEAMGLCAFWEKYLGIPVIYTETGGSEVVLPQMSRGELDIANIAFRDINISWHGLAEYKEQPPIDVYYMWAYNYKLLDQYFTFVARPGLGIKTIQDLVGKKVCYEEAMSATSTEMAQAVLEQFGILDKIVRIPPMTREEKQDAMIMGRVDAFYCNCRDAIPVLQSIPDLVFIETPVEDGKKIKEKIPYVQPWGVPAGYGRTPVPEGFGALLLPGGYVASGKTSEYTIYMLLKTMYEHFDEIIAMSPMANRFTVDVACNDTVTAPYHPGAVRYFKEAGYWSKEVEEHQKMLFDTR